MKVADLASVLDKVGDFDKIVELRALDLDPEEGGRVSEGNVTVRSDSQPGQG